MERQNVWPDFAKIAPVRGVDQILREEGKELERKSGGILTAEPRAIIGYSGYQQAAGNAGGVFDYFIHRVDNPEIGFSIVNIFEGEKVYPAKVVSMNLNAVYVADSEEKLLEILARIFSDDANQALYSRILGAVGGSRVFY